MQHIAAEPLAWTAGLAASASTLMGSLAGEAVSGGGWLPLIVQAGMAGIVVLIVLKHIPELIRAQQRANDQHAENLRLEREAFERVMNRIVESNERKDAAWQQIISQRGHCPVRDGDSHGCD